jgi:ADP-heptose:LPS heptosyltransferase
MPTPKAAKIKQCYYQGKLRCQYLNRIVRACFVRLLLKLSLPLFKLESRFAPAGAKNGKKILVIVIGGLGDCLLFDSLFRRLKEKWPEARIDVLSGSFEQMWQSMASVDNLILFTPTKFKHPWAYIKLFRSIYHNRYDIVAEGIAMLPKRGIYPIFTSLIFAASQAPIRIGRKNTGRIGLMRQRDLGFIGREEMRARNRQRPKAKPNPYLTHELDITPPEKRSAHESTYIFEPLGLTAYRLPEEPRLAADPANDAWALHRLRSQWAGHQSVLIGITLETTRKIKTWPLANFLEIIHHGISDGFKFVLVGLDRKLAQAVMAHFSSAGVLNLAGRTSLGQMIAAIRQCDFFLSGDTGPAHIAQACQTPAVVLFGPSNEKEFGPADYSRHSLILPPASFACRPCVLGPCVRGRSCILSIEPGDVYNALKQKIERFSKNAAKPIPQQRTTPQHLICVV